jgi:hypothetical protein
MTRQNVFRLFLTQSKDPDKDCDCQPTWLSLTLAILPAALPVLIDKIGDILTCWFFREDEAEEVKPKRNKQ